MSEAAVGRVMQEKFAQLKHDIESAFQGWRYHDEKHRKEAIDRVTKFLCEVEENARLFAAASSLLREVQIMHENLVAEIDDMDCTVNWVNGDSADTCEHCLKRDYRDRLKEILTVATGEKY